jgi:hypothetical protein
MPFISLNDFEHLLFHTQPTNLADEYIIGGDPFVFRDEPDDFSLLQAHLCESLGTDRLEVAIVGSAKTGFSLNPNHYGVHFSAKSDIDVAVINEDLFDTIWHCVLDWHYPRRSSLPQSERDWAHRRMRELFWGWFRPDAIKYDDLLLPRPLRDARRFSTKWFDAFQSLSLIKQFTSRTVSGRLYRTRRHAVAYHAAGLRLIRRQLEQRR